eukprot:3738185-Rhodomonas_salina.1
MLCAWVWTARGREVSDVADEEVFWCGVASRMEQRLVCCCFWTVRKCAYTRTIPRVLTSGFHTLQSSSHFDAKLLQDDYLLVEPLNYLLRLRPEKLNEKVARLLHVCLSAYIGDPPTRMQKQDPN